MPREIDLTGPQRAVLVSVFAPFRDHIESVGVYGSRARGDARPGSDVDLVIYGRVDPNIVAAVRAQLEYSDLSIFADVVAYDDICTDRLRVEIDRWAMPLDLGAKIAL